MFADASRTGAAAMTRVARKNPTELLRRMRDQDKTASSERLFRAWMDVVREDEEYLVAALHHAFTNINTTLERDDVRIAQIVQASAPARQRQDPAIVQARVDALKAQITKVVMLQLVMPNGKTLGECTGTECVRFGGLYTNIGKKVGTKNVADVLNEAQVQRLLS